MAVKDYRIHCGKSTLVLFQFWRGIMRAWSQKTQIGYRLFKYSLSLRLSVQQSFQHAGIYYTSNSISLDGITGNALRCLQMETLTASVCYPLCAVHVTRTEDVLVVTNERPLKIFACYCEARVQCSFVDSILTGVKYSYS